MNRTFARSAALAVPLLLVNSAAVYGQAGWAYDHLTHVVVLAILFAASIESIGIYLAYEAHAALMAGDASARLRFGSYLVGALAGTLNFAHFADPHYRPNPLAVTFGVLSSISPWLWSIRSRSMNRDRLRELGQIDPRAVRFSLLRWVLFPVRTSQAFRGAIWHGIVEPTKAVEAADALRAPVQTVSPVLEIEPEPVPEPEPEGESDDFDAMVRALFDEGDLDPSGPSEPVLDLDAEPVLEKPAPRRKNRLSDQQILRRLTNPKAVPRADDGTVPIRLVEDLFAIGQPRAERLLREVGLHPSGAAEPVPVSVNGAVPETP